MCFEHFAWRWFLEPGLLTLAEDAPDLSEILNAAGDFLRSALSWLLQNDSVRTVLGWIMAPATSLLGIHHPPYSGYGLLFLLLLGWFMWARSLRVSYCIAARAFGFYHPRQSHTLTRLWIAWRKPYQALMFLRRWWRQFRYGKGASRDWTGFLETASYLYSPDDDCILVGRLSFKRIPLFQPVAIPGGGRHVAYIAASGAGKTTQIQSAHIGCLHPSQAACIVDCDGAMVAAHGAALEAEGHRCIKLDADNIDKTFPCGKWNPLDELTRADLELGRCSVVSYAAILANALIVQDSSTQPVFADTARVFVKGLLLYVWLCDGRKNLMRFRELLTTGLVLPDNIGPDDEALDPFETLLFEMSDLPARFANGEFDDGCNGEICAAIAAAAGVMNMGRSDKGNNFLSTARYQTSFLDDPAIRAMMESSDISGADLKIGKNAPVVFLVSSLQDIQTRTAPFFRAFLMLTLYHFQRIKPEMKLKHPAVILCDEMPSLNRMETLALAAPGLRKYQIRLICVTQSLQRLQKSYPMEWRDFLGNAQCCVFMGLDDPETLQFLSQEMLGKTLRKEKVDGYHWFVRMLARCIGIKSLPPARYQMVERWVLDPQQCREFLDPSSGNIIVTRFGRAPMRLMRFSYWKELPVWKYAVNGYGESPLRCLTRAFIAWAEPAAKRLSFALEQKARAAEVKLNDGFTHALGLQFAAAFFGTWAAAAGGGLWSEPGLLEHIFGTAALIVGAVCAVAVLYMPLRHAWRKLTPPAKMRRRREPEQPYRRPWIVFGLSILAFSFVTSAIAAWLRGLAPKELPSEITDPALLPLLPIVIPGVVLYMISGIASFVSACLLNGPMLYVFYLGLLLFVWNPLLLGAAHVAAFTAWLLTVLTLPVGRTSPALARWLTARAAGLVDLSLALRAMRLSTAPMDRG